jgi:hypothetical protein
MKVHLNDTKEELEKEKENLGLSKESAGEENIYGISLPIAINTCRLFRKEKSIICWKFKIKLSASKQIASTTIDRIK